LKSVPAPLQTNFDLATSSIEYGLKIVRKNQLTGADENTYGFTSHNSDDVIDGVTYQSSPGVDVTAIVNTAGLQVGNLELTTLDDGEVFTTEDVLAGKWRNASFTLFRYNWESVSDGVETIIVGTLGEIQILQSKLIVELRDLRQYLQHPVGSPSTKTCRWRLGDSRCGINLATSPNTFTVTGTITSVTSKQVFVDSSRTEADRWFEGGIITWTSGNNTGLSMPVKIFESLNSPNVKQITLFRSMIQTVQVGDGYSMTAGCDKTLETCISKFSNVLNFGGEPHRPTLDEIAQSPTTSV
jgi:uncharacterized phage protein (TIGR02218 family)